MPRGFGRLPFLARPRAAADPSRADNASDDPGLDADERPVGPPVLLPAMIHSVILIHATELTPAWARPRPAAEPATSETSAPTAEAAKQQPAASTTETPSPKPARRRKASGASAEPKTPATPRNPRKPAASRRRAS
jgi:hypothetical protein